MNLPLVLAVIKKDSIQLFRKKILLFTLIIIPVLMGLVLPIGFAWFIIELDSSTLTDPEVLDLLNRFLATTASPDVLTLTFNEQLLYLFLNYPLVTLFLLVPVITCSVIAANSFVSEKEQHTLESLLFSPITIRDLFYGKLLISIASSYLISAVCFLINLLVINTLISVNGFSVSFPSTQWWVLLFLLLPILLLTTALINLLISTRVSTYQEAQNLSGIIILPFIGLIIGQISGLFFINTLFLILLSIGLLILNVFLLKLALRFGTRDQLFNSQMS
ncbi:ABC transporter permease [Exiguobacterium sp. H66]|uniref:ABC transporter permease n=1 Tax=Exiguobacterium sp. H66 TaxID=2751208 RepID=UPI001BEC9339|nr:ABC transporter permease [Exiguobacterium sp. H66]